MRRFLDYRAMRLLLGLAWVACLWSCLHPRPNPSNEVKTTRAGAAHEQLNIAERHSDRSAAPEKAVAPSATLPTSGGETDGPDWLDGTSTAHDPALYFLGVGMGADRRAAENNARAEIAKIFHSDIQATTAVYQQYFSRSASSPATVTERIDIQAITRVTTRKVLSGITIAGHYHGRYHPGDPHYVLAVLDRRHAAAVLTHKVRDLDRQIVDQLSKSTSQPNPLVRVQHVSRGLTLFIQRQLYDTELRIVHPDGSGIAPDAAIRDIDARLEHILKNDCLIKVSVSGSQSKDIRQALISALNRRGFAVTESETRATVWARGSARITPVEQESAEWQFVRWKAYFDLVDQTGVVFGSVVKTGKTGHLTLKEAEQRAVRKMNALLSTEIADTLADYILQPPAPEAGPDQD